jgi:stage II sporulation protein D
MFSLKILFFFLLSVLYSDVSAQVKIRLYSRQSPESAVFSVSTGMYYIYGFYGQGLEVTKGESVVISRYNGKLIVKSRIKKGFVCDSVSFIGKTGSDAFTLMVNEYAAVRQKYQGDLKVYPDLATLVMVNSVDIEQYIAGVVKAEGGNGKNFEYFKSQAVICRTYMYKYMNKHTSDRYNLCDNTHCQAFNGLTSDTLIIRAALITKGQVILDSMNRLIISAFHSNCGGQTASAAGVWLTNEPYLRATADPFCLTSRNAGWERRLSLNDWLEYLNRSGFKARVDEQPSYNFYQRSRLNDYSISDFRIPLTRIRADWHLRSAFFSVVAEGDSIILRGKGYGHGVGLCQEGAMVMAAKGLSYRQIIDFYYSGVFIRDIRNAVMLQ